MVVDNYVFVIGEKYLGKMDVDMVVKFIRSFYVIDIFRLDKVLEISLRFIVDDNDVFYVF